jgi:hypothetical protein
LEIVKLIHLLERLSTSAIKEDLQARPAEDESLRLRKLIINAAAVFLIIIKRLILIPLSPDRQGLGAGSGLRPDKGQGTGRTTPD